MARWVIANWKMHFTLEEARAAASGIAERVRGLPGVEIGIAPPFPFLAAVREATGQGILVGAQDMHWEEKGAFTGEVSGPMLASMGLDFVLVGHSERRKLFGETDESVNRKAIAAIRTGLRPVVCVGETLEQRQAGDARDIVRGQLEKGLSGVEGDFDLAYEPVWAIGTGVNATPDQVAEMHSFIREMIGNARVLYGGSVSPDNAGDLAAVTGVDGFLVGGASLSPEKFEVIAKKTAEVQR